MSWTVAGVTAATDLDGLPTNVVERDGTPPLGAASHLNTTTIIDHIVVATPAIDRTIAAFVAVGMEPRRERVGGSASMPMRQVFLRMGEVIIDLMADWAKIFVGLVVPFLAIAALIESYITPSILLQVMAK